MRILILLWFTFFSTVAVAQSGRSSLRFYLLNAESRFERASSQDTVNRNPYNLAVGYYFPKYSVIVDYSHFKETSGNPTSLLERTHRDLIIWGRYHIWAWRQRESLWNAAIYVGLGGGAYEEQVITQFMGTHRTDKGGARFLSGASAGVEGSVSLSQDFSFIGSLEGRMLAANNFDPNPIWGGVLRCGFALHF